MRKVNKIRTAIRASDATNLCGNISLEIQSSSIEDRHLASIGAEINTIHQKMVIALSRVKAGSVLKERNSKRVNAYRSAINLTKGYLFHPDLKIKAAATKVLDVLKAYGSALTIANYSAISGMLDSLFVKFNKPEIVTIIELLPGLEELIDKLIESQKNFKEAEALWNTIKRDNKQKETATALKKKFIKLLNVKLVVYIQAHVQSEPEIYKDLTLKVALLIDKANALIKRRKKAMANGGGDQSES